MSWLDLAIATEVVDYAALLGREVRRSPSASHCACPACGAERRHPSRGDRRGAVGIPTAKPCTWRCHACGAGGDGLDFLACALFGARFRDLDARKKSDVRTWLEEHTGIGRTQVAYRRPAPIAPPAPVYPPIDDLRLLWSSGLPVHRDAPIAGYLEFRGLDARDVYRHDLAFGLPFADLPGWACVAGANWPRTGHRLIVPLFGADGRMRSVLARSVERAPMLKSVAPSGFSRAGLVMANRVAIMTLRGKARPAEVIVREGEIDYLAESIATPDVAVFGIVSGSWTAEIAARIPDGAHVIVATDPDDAGDRYAEVIAATLRGRVQLERRRVAA